MIVRELVTLLGYEVDEASLNRAERKINAVANRMQDIGKKMTAFVTLPIVGIGAASVKASADLEQLGVAFTTMLGDADKADQLIRDMTEFAIKTPFTIKGVEESAKQLLAMGISNEKLLPTLKSLGDVSAGLSVPLGRIAYNYGQIATQGKATSRDLRDFAVAGVPIIDELAKSLGVAKTEIAGMVSAGKISFDMVEQAFISMSSEGGRFANLMDKQSKTLSGRFSNLMDSIIKTARVIGEMIIETFRLDLVVGALGNGLESLTKWLDNLSPAMKKFIVITFTLIAAIGPLMIASGILLKSLIFIKGALLAGAAAGTTFSLSLLWIPALILAVIAALIILGNEIYVWVTGGETLIGKFLGTWENFRDKVVELFSPLVDSFIDMTASIMKVLGGLLKFVGGVFTGQWEQAADGIKQAFFGVLEYFKAWAKNTVAFLLLPFRALGGAFGAIKKFLPSSWKGLGTSLLAAGNITLAGANALDNFSIGGDVASSGNSQTININSKNEITVPQGTSEEQKQFIEEKVRGVVREENQRAIDAVVANTSGGER